MTRAFLSSLLQKRWKLDSLLRYDSTDTTIDMDTMQSDASLALIGAIFSEKGPTICKQFIKDCLLQKQDDPLQVCYGLLTEQNDAEALLNDLQFAETFTKVKKVFEQQSDGTYSVSFYHRLTLLGFAKATNLHSASKLAATNAILQRLRRLPGY